MATKPHRTHGRSSRGKRNRRFVRTVVDSWLLDFASRTVATIASALIVAISTTAAYAFARLRFVHQAAWRRARTKTAAKAAEARDASCRQIRQDLTLAHDRGVRASAMTRRHLRECPGCREFRAQLRGTSRQLAALVPVGPVAAVAKLLGLGSGGAAASGGAATSGGAAAGSGGIASAAALVTGAGHVATILAAAVVTAGGAVEIQHTLAPYSSRHAPPQASTVSPGSWRGCRCC